MEADPPPLQLVRYLADDQVQRSKRGQEGPPRIKPKAFFPNKGGLSVDGRERLGQLLIGSQLHFPGPWSPAINVILSYI